MKALQKLRQRQAIIAWIHAALGALMLGFLIALIAIIFLLFS